MYDECKNVISSIAVVTWNDDDDDANNFKFTNALITMVNDYECSIPTSTSVFGVIPY